MLFCIVIMCCLVMPRTLSAPVASNSTSPLDPIPAANETDVEGNNPEIILHNRVVEVIIRIPDDEDVPGGGGGGGSDGYDDGYEVDRDTRPRIKNRDRNRNENEDTGKRRVFVSQGKNRKGNPHSVWDRRGSDRDRHQEDYPTRDHQEDYPARHQSQEDRYQEGTRRQEDGYQDDRLAEDADQMSGRREPVRAQSWSPENRIKNTERKRPDRGDEKDFERLLQPDRDRFVSDQESQPKNERIHWD